MTSSPSRPRDGRPAALAGLLAALLLWACADTGTEGQICMPGTYSCSANTLMRCAGDGTGYVVVEDCSARDRVCHAESRGCLVCIPDALGCSGADIVRCNSRGSGYLPDPVRRCDAAKGEVCSNQICVNACDLSRRNRSYVGCEYWAVDLDNAVVTRGNAAAQQFALVLSNPSALSARVTVSIDEAPYGKPAKEKVVTERTIKPQALELVLLPSREVDGSPPGQYNTGGGTAVTPNAYRIRSSVPIIAYQFNPLSNAGVFSNDASLLVPTPALTVDAASELGADYLVMGWPQTIATTTDPTTNFGSDLRAFLTLVGTREKTRVKISLTTGTIPDREGRVPARKKGETLSFTLGPYEVLNLETGGFGADFTGTRISTDRPVAVFSGSEASDVPDFTSLRYRKCCADHLEQQLFPVTTLGKVFIALTTPSRTEALNKAGASITVNRREKEVFRVLSAGEFVKVTTSLPDQPLLDVASGKFAQITADRDFTIEATGPVAVGQFVASQDETGIPSSLPGGDPSFILLPPVEQFRKDYLFLTPDKYAFDFILVAAPDGAKVRLDGRLLTPGCDSSGGRKLCCTVGTAGSVVRPAEKTRTRYLSYKCQLSFPRIQAGAVPPDNLLAGDQNDGVHRLTSTRPAGLVVYGFDAYVSYGYPGGTDLALINLK